MSVTVWPAMRPGVRRRVLFDFSADLASGETVGSPVVTVALVEGTDASPGLTLESSPQVDGAGKVYHWVRARADGAVYGLEASVTTSAGQELKLPVRLPVRGGWQ